MAYKLHAIWMTKAPIRQAVIERERFMGRALTRFAAWDIAILCVVEFAITFTVLHHMQDPQYANGLLLTDGALTLSRPWENLGIGIAIFAGLLTIIAGLLHPEIRLNRAKLLGAACVSGILAFPVVLLLSGMYVDGTLTARGLWLLRIIGVWLVIIAACRLMFSLIAQRTSPRRILMLGDAERIQRLGERLNCRLGRRFEPLFAVQVGASFDASPAGFPVADVQALTQLRRQRVWGIVVATTGEHSLSGQLLDYKLRGMKILSEQSFQEQHLRRIDLDSLTINDLLFGSGYVNDLLSQVSKRICDILVSVALLMATLPLMAVTAVAIKIDTPGPVFYRQQRVGLFGRPFTLLKFRSMSVDAEAGGAPIWAQKKDPRITKVGAFIRATRIDELPQLANVLLGQMSLVGPRPERPHFVDQLSQAIPFYRERNYVKPGVTGWAQVNFPYGASVEDAREKLAYDLYYVKHRGITLDLEILLATVRVVLFREGAR